MSIEDAFKERKPDPAQMSDAHFDKWIAYKERGRNQIVGLVAFLSFTALAVTALTVLVWSPWNG